MSREAGAATGATGPDATYRGHLAAGEIRVQRCDGCAETFFPPRAMCPACGARAATWVAIAGGATVYSASTVRQKPERGGDYVIVLVDLDEGPRLMTTVTDIAPSEVRIGQRVRLAVGELGGEPAVVATVGEAAR